MTNKLIAAFLILTGTIFISSVSYAEVKLPAIFGDHMVLQQKEEDLVYSGPLYKDMKIEGSRIRLSFDYTGSGLTASDDGPLTHFRVAGEDREFVNATAIIEDDTVVVSSNDVSSPVAVRFAFTSEALPNLCNKERLPASSFRTDDWPLE